MAVAVPVGKEIPPAGRDFLHPPRSAPGSGGGAQRRGTGAGRRNMVSHAQCHISSRQRTRSNLVSVESDRDRALGD